MRTIITWILTAIVALAFAGAGLAKLTNQPMLVESFNSFGYPMWFMYLTGTIEIVCAALLFVPRFAFVGCGILVCVMIGALFAHLTHGQYAKTPPVFVLLILLIVLGSLRNWGGVYPFVRNEAGGA